MVNGWQVRVSISLKNLNRTSMKVVSAHGGENWYPYGHWVPLNGISAWGIAVQASTLTSVIPPKRTKIINDGQFSKSIRQKTDENHQGLV